jgi:hypothetical protein
MRTNKKFQSRSLQGLKKLPRDSLFFFSISMFIYPASSWTEGIISSYAPLLAGRLKGSVYMLAYVGYLPTEEYQKHKKAAAEDKLVMAPSSVR